MTDATAVDALRPVPRPLPVVGHALRLLVRPRQFLESLYGCGDIVGVRLARTPAYLICAPERPVFERSRIAAYCGEFATVAAAAADSWDEAREIDAVHEMKAVASLALARTIFAGSPDTDSITEITRSIPILVDGIGKRMVAPLAPLHKLPTPQNRRYDSANARMHTLTDRIIDEYRGAR